MKTLSALTLTILISSFSAAQAPIKIKKRSLEIDINQTGTKIVRVITRETNQREILNVSKVRSGDLKEYVHWNTGFESKPEFDAYTDNSGIPNARKKKRKVESITQEDYSSRGVFYDGTKLFTLTYPGVESGSILNCVTTKEEKDAHLIPPFYFDDYNDCEISELIVRFPKSVEVGFLNFNHDPSYQIEFEESQDKDIITYRWKAKNVKTINYESDSRGRSCHSPHTIVHIKTYGSLNDRTNVLRDKNDLFNWYASLVSDQKLGDHQLAIVDSLKRNSGTDSELAENIFNWVQHNIKYIAYEDGFGGFIPRTPESVVHNRFGDCKDMALLTKTMMNAADLDCHIAWVGTRSKCYTYDNCPTPLVDNHMIAAYPTGEDYIFLDPTSSYSVFGKPSSFVQGKEAMIRTSESTFEVVPIPIITGQDNLTHTIIHAKIEGTDLVGRGTNQLSGYGKEHYENVYDNRLSGKEQLFSDFISIGNEGVKIENLKQENLDSNKGSIDSKFDFTLKNHLRTFENETYLNPFIQEVINIDIDDREHLLDLDYKEQFIVEINVEIPDGVNVDVPFESETIDENGFLLEITTSLKENALQVSYSFTCNRIQINPEEFKEVRSSLKKMNKKLNKQITLTNEI
ncbi:MAG: transglutaminase family protein [Crocinitomicaceae bacterium]